MYNDFSVNVVKKVVKVKVKEKKTPRALHCIGHWVATFINKPVMIVKD